MTDQPQTLPQIAGAAPTPDSFADAALVVIDAQREYATGRLPLAGIADASAQIGALLARARAQGTPVFHIVHHEAEGAPIFDPARQAVAIIPGLEPAPGERLITKALPNSFAGTALLEAIRETGRPALIVAGFMTHMCVNSTVRAAIDTGLRVTLVAGATATRDLPGAAADEVLPAASLQAATLAALADYGAAVVPDAGAVSAA